MRDAITVVNTSRKGILKSMWDIKNIELMEPTIEYIVPSTLTFKRRTKINTIWKKYEVTENGRISIFSTMERLKLVYAAIMQSININYLISTQYLL